LSFAISFAILNRYAAILIGNKQTSCYAALAPCKLKAQKCISL